MSPLTETQRETVFLANYAVESGEQAASVRALRRTLVPCEDCEHETPAGELDGSTGLCEFCYECAGIENAMSDGHTSESDGEREIAAIRETQSRERESEYVRYCRQAAERSERIGGER